MERFSFAPEAAFVPRGDLLDRVSLAPLTPSSAEGALVQAVILRFEPGGRLRRHPAGSPQILAVLEGSGEVSGANGVDEPIGAGEAVFLHEGEDHELKSEAGLTALIIEGWRACGSVPRASEGRSLRDCSSDIPAPWRMRRNLPQ